MITTIRHLPKTKCPTCGGTGKGDFPSFAFGPSCETCRGWKTVVSEEVDNTAIIEAMRTLCLGMREMAEAWGCSLRDVSLVRQNAAVVEHRLVEGGPLISELESFNLTELLSDTTKPAVEGGAGEGE